MEFPISGKGALVMDMLGRIETAGAPETLLAHMQKCAPSTKGGIRTLVSNLEGNLTTLCRRVVPGGEQLEVNIDPNTATIRFTQLGKSRGSVQNSVSFRYYQSNQRNDT